MTSREQKIWDTVNAWAKHQNPSIPDDNLRGLMDDVLGVVESEVGEELRNMWEVVTLIYEDAKERVDGRCRDLEFQKIRMDEYEYLIPILFPDGEPTEKRSLNAAPRLDDPAV